MLRRTANHRRAGFTIVELLIVITIIAVLMTLVLKVVGAYILSARETATRTTIQKIHKLLRSRMEAFHRLYGSNDPASQARVRTSAPYYAIKQQYPAAPDSLIMVLARKGLFAKYFPQRFAEVDPFLQPTLVNAVVNGGA